jgi:hypothetical protein
MKLIANDELYRMTERELSGLFHSVSQGLVRSDGETPERRNALASLENIARARAYVLARA